MPRLQSFRAILVLTFLLLIALPQIAHAQAWTLPEDEFGLEVAWDFQQATDEYLPDGKFQRFPINGEFLAHTLRFRPRYGFTDRLEGEAEISFKSIGYQSDPLLPMLPENPDDPMLAPDIKDVRGGIVDFSQSRFGAGDIWLRLRYSLLKTATAINVETGLKVPTGYEPPRETFQTDPDGSTTVADDVALGDGQADLEARWNFGHFFVNSRTFTTANAGFRWRFGTPGPQALGELKIGQSVGQHVLFFAGSDVTYTVFDGDVIGQTVTSTAPEQSAIDFDGSTELVDLRLDKDYVTVRGGIILTFDGVELQGAYSRIVWGRNIPAINTVTVSAALRFPAVLPSQ